jgi:hypothetical protein
MEHWNPLHKQSDQKGELGAPISVHKLPLLPFEKDLIEVTGISEEDYRFFVAEVSKRSAERPLEYEIVPDVRGEITFWTAVAINLVIGAALTAVSYLLMPKPRVPGGGGEGVRQRQLASREGLNVFAPTTGFDSQAQLASYGEPIPVIFGLYTGATGGMLVSPKLVWSRGFSYGTQQGVKQLYVVSEQGVGSTGIDKPDLPGIFLGNTPLDAAFDHTFAFYWRSSTFNGTSRIKKFNQRYGVPSGVPDSGDPETDNDVFSAPTDQGLNEPAFSQCYSLSSNSEFGVHSPIYNGTDYRVNWKIVSIPRLVNQEDDPEWQLLRERIKIAGTYGLLPNSDGNRTNIRAQGQRGTGRGYSRRMGITAHNGTSVTSAAGFEVRSVSVGDTCAFTILPNRLPQNFYFGQETEAVQVDDINSEIDSQCSTADSLLQLGETFQIGYTLWKVVDRSIEIWKKGETQEIILECVELLGTGVNRRQIGLVSRNRLLLDYVDDVDDSTPIGFYPLMRTQIATVRNTRPCNVTEIGIKSQVWNRSNNLCNFNSLPSPAALVAAEGRSVALSSGTMNLYFKRTSAFALQVRPADLDEEGELYQWAPVGDGFCVTSEQPRDLYNFIRIIHPERKQFEFRIVPRSGADVIRHMSATSTLWQLDARLNEGNQATLSASYSTPYGSIRVFAAGRMVQVGEVEFNPEMSTNPVFTGIGSTNPAALPTAIEIASWLPSTEADGDLIPKEYLRQAFKWELFGKYYKNGGGSYDLNEIASLYVTYSAGGKSIRIRWQAQLLTNDGANFPTSEFGRVWGPISWFVDTAGSSGSWSINETLNIQMTLDPLNPLVSRLPEVRLDGETSGPFLTVAIKITAVDQQFATAGWVADRIFENNSQLADVSFYSDLLGKSNQSSPEHAISYVNEIVENETVPNYDYLTMAGLALKASRTYASLDQLRVWKDDGIPVERFHPSELGTVGPSNIFADLVFYLLTDKIAGAGNTISRTQIKTVDFTKTAEFLRANGLFFDGAITEPGNIRTIVGDYAPFFLCNFVISDGLFSILPALPTNVGGTISTGAVPISGLFTSGNIIENSFSLEYINSEERNKIQAIMRYRKGAKNQLPEERTINIRWNEQDSDSHRIESFDMTQYCTSAEHAILAGKYLLSVRRRITHTVRFKTTPQGISLAPGSYIRVVTQASPYSGVNNGVISATGEITSISEVQDGAYNIFYYIPGAPDIQSGTLNVVSGATTQPELLGAVFSVMTGSVNSNTYIVEQITLDEEGLVDIVASEFPTNASYGSIIAQDVLSTSAFVIDGVGFSAELAQESIPAAASGASLSITVSLDPGQGSVSSDANYWSDMSVQLYGWEALAYIEWWGN